MTDAKWKHLEDCLGSRGTELLAGLSEAERHQAWLATKALLRRPAGRARASPLLTAESAFEAAIQRLRAARAGDAASELAFGRLVREGYEADREECLGGLAAGLDRRAWQEVSGLAFLAYRQGRVSPRDAITQALRVAFDRDRHPEPTVRAESVRTLTAVGKQLEVSPGLGQDAAGFVLDHLGDLDGLLRAC